MEENKNITPKDQLLAITSAIILAGLAANTTTVCPSTSHIKVAKTTAQDLLDSILN